MHWESEPHTPSVVRVSEGLDKANQGQLSLIKAEKFFSDAALRMIIMSKIYACLLYTSDAADE